MKNNLLIVFMLLITILTAFAVQARVDQEDSNVDFDDLEAHDLGTIKWDYNQTPFYEHTKGNFTLLVENVNGQNITQLVLNVSPMLINYSDRCSFSGSIATCNVNLEETYSVKRKFIFVAPEVEQNTTFPVNLTTYDFVGDVNYSILNIEVINDTIAPIYDLISPTTNHAIIKNGTNYDFKINYTEVGSGLKNVTLYYEYVDSYLGSSSSVNTTPFPNPEEEKLFEGNLSSDEFLYIHIDTMDGDYLPFFKYKYKLYDKAGNLNTGSTKWIFLDNETPEVTLSTPTNNTLMTNIDQLKEFNFTVYDNSFDINSVFDGHVICELYIDNELKNTSEELSDKTINNNLTANISDLDDGTYEWYVICNDAVDHSTKSNIFAFSIDTKAPTIELHSHKNNSIVNNNTNITFKIIDHNNVSNISSVNNTINKITYNKKGYVYFNISSADLNYGKNTIIIYANDTLGNTNSENFTIFMDNVTPKILTLTATANKNEVTISLKTNENTTNKLTFDGKSYDLEEGNTTTKTIKNLKYSTEYDYYVTVCDKANNCNTSETKSITTEKQPTTPGGSGGGSFDYDCEENWTCSDWTTCTNSLQTRTCEDQNNCLTEEDKPILTQKCTMPTVATVDLSVEPEETIINVSDKDYEEVGIDNKITGAVVGGGSKGIIWIAAFIGVVIAGFVGINIYNRRV